mmetsp:Transcript_42361/g.109001  ORF Transcript_42361/g.109001 Transcript_42361/m.109001 type:complete len:129 (-) Transcript_42361:147-533(-)|eukprot:CAMPEP_0113893834 /NCGR_PEP_ID=MMETSP0780_2-20120614/16332_1 /TAXON_ID=652834 /ORGANISM="Palpitomonas bilix" /LENGTH=128 /DNA_ID=CAMNT_0000884207 /DNA_START=93 /DNA_END=479 /DNA_ORIENTATION=- /assembly_acc=CAM_ASM_000599
MAAKKAVEIQKEIADMDAWNEFKQWPGLVLAQVYSEWCGKCECIEGTLKRIKAEKDDAPVEFVLLEASKFDFLKEYRNRSKPYFAFYKQGELIESVEGVDGPKILQLLDQCLPSKQEYEEALAELNKK